MSAVQTPPTPASTCVSTALDRTPAIVTVDTAWDQTEPPAKVCNSLCTYIPSLLDSISTLNLPEIHECLEGLHLCEHLCTNTNGSYICSCNTGYFLASNGFSCTSMYTSTRPLTFDVTFVSQMLMNVIRALPCVHRTAWTLQDLTCAVALQGTPWLQMDVPAMVRILVFVLPKRTT